MLVMSCKIGHSSKNREQAQSASHGLVSGWSCAYPGVGSGGVVSPRTSGFTQQHRPGAEKGVADLPARPLQHLHCLARTAELHRTDVVELFVRHRRQHDVAYAIAV
jgi:hypothetical protein